jgi:hypothetical protein
MGVRALEIGDVDGDGREEIIYPSADLYTGFVRVFDGGTRAIKRQSADYEDVYFSALALADVDQDGDVEIVAGQGRSNTGAAGVYLVVFNGATMAEEWRSVDLGIYWGEVSDIAVADVDADGQPEIVAAMADGRLHVYDGVTHQLDWLASLTAHSVAIADVNLDGAPEIVVGRPAGLVEAYNGQTHALLSSRNIGGGAIAALRSTGDPGGAVWLLASDGQRLKHFSWAGSAVEWQSPNLGRDLAAYNQLVAQDVEGDGAVEFIAGSHYALFQYDFPAGGANVQPTLDAIPDAAIDEGAGTQSVALSGITAGVGESQTLRVSAASSNTALIPKPTVTYVSPAGTGSLAFAPAAADANGTATITVTVNDGQASNNTVSRSFVVTVHAVNDAPRFTKGANKTVYQSAAAQTVTGWATSINAGPANESAQALDFIVTNNNNALFSAQPAIDAAGTLTFMPAAGATGSATVTVQLHDDGGTAGGGVDTSGAQTFTITVAVNNPPTLGSLSPVTIAEDAGQRTVSLWGITAPYGESQTLTVTAVSSNTALIPNPTVTYTSPSMNGTLAFTPVANASGAATITVTVNDGQALNNTCSQSFLVTVNAVNDAPSFVKGANQAVFENAGAQTVSSWATGISAGPPDESGQALDFIVTNDNNALFSTQPAVDAAGALTFTPATDAFGSATVTVQLHDNGGTANSGVDTSAAQTFTMTVTKLNDAPTLDALGDVALAEDAGQQAVNLAGISAGTGDVQTLTVTASSSDTGVIPDPTVSYASPNATGSLGFTPVANANGTATITVTVDDGQTANNTVVRTFLVAVSAVNDAPSFTKGADLTVAEDAGAQSASGWATSISAGPANESAQAVDFVVSNDNNALFSAQPAVDAAGTLTFTPAADAFGSATVTVRVHDDGGTANGGVDTSGAQTFTITVTAVNDPPTLDALDPLTIAEDAVLQTVGLGGISAGPANESAQTPSVTASSSNPAVIPHPTVTYASPATTGSLQFTPVANASGTATITVTVDDGGATNNTVARTFLVTVTPVDEPPTDIALSNSLVAESVAADTPVGTLSTVDPDSVSFTYSLAAGAGDTDNGSFTIVGNELRTLLPLDFRTRNPYRIRVQSSDGANAVEESFTISTPAYVLWSRGDNGRAVLWQVDPAQPVGAGQLKRMVSLYTTSGIGSGWQATSYAHVSATEGYVLLTRSDNGRAVLWQVNPSLPVGPAQLTRMVSLYTTAGIGAGWLATSYAHVSPTEGYVLLTRSDNGRAVLWQVDPSLPVGPTQLTRMVSLYTTAGIGAGWQATSYTHVSATEGYVLLTRSDNGRAVLWQVNPSLPVGPAQLTRMVSLYTTAGIGAGWQATSYAHVGATEGYVLWTRSDNGRAVLWQVDPSLPVGPAQLTRMVSLYTTSGIGAGWQANSLFRLGPVTPAAPGAPVSAEHLEAAGSAINRP